MFKKSQKPKEQTQKETISQEVSHHIIDAVHVVNYAAKLTNTHLPHSLHALGTLTEAVTKIDEHSSTDKVEKIICGLASTPVSEVPAVLVSTAIGTIQAYKNKSINAAAALTTAAAAHSIVKELTKPLEKATLHACETFFQSRLEGELRDKGSKIPRINPMREFIPSVAEVGFPQASVEASVSRGKSKQAVLPLKEKIAQSEDPHFSFSGTFCESTPRQARKSKGSKECYTSEVDLPANASFYPNQDATREAKTCGTWQPPNWCPDEIRHSGQNKTFLYVITKKKKLRISPRIIPINTIPYAPSRDYIYHSELNGCDGVFAAGEVKTDSQGNIKEINNLSGHFMPKGDKKTVEKAFIQNGMPDAKGKFIDCTHTLFSLDKLQTKRPDPLDCTLYKLQTSGPFIGFSDGQENLPELQDLIDADEELTSQRQIVRIGETLWSPANESSGSTEALPISSAAHASADLVQELLKESGGISRVLRRNIGSINDYLSDLDLNSSSSDFSNFCNEYIAREISRLELSGESARQFSQLFQFAVGPRLLVDEEGHFQINTDGLRGMASMKKLKRFDESQLNTCYQEMFSPLAEACTAPRLFEDIVQGLKRDVFLNPEHADTVVGEGLTDTGFSLTDAYHCAVIGTAFLGLFGNAKSARELRVVASSACTIGETAFALAKGTINPLKGFMTLGLAVEGLVSLFADDDDDENPLFEVIQQLAGMLHQLRQELHQRFERLEEQLSSLDRHLTRLNFELWRVSKRMNQQHEENKILHSHTREGLEAVRGLLQVHDDESQKQYRAQAIAPLMTSINAYLDTPGVSQDKRFLRQLLKEFTTHTQRTVFESALSGEQSGRTWPTGDNPDLAGYIINRFTSGNALPNPLYWSAVSSVFLNFFYMVYHNKERPMSQEEFSRITAMQNTANQLHDFFCDLKKPSVLFVKLRDYRDALNGIHSALNRWTIAKGVAWTEKLNAEHAERQKAKQLHLLDVFIKKQLKVNAMTNTYVLAQQVVSKIKESMAAIALIHAEQVQHAIPTPHAIDLQGDYCQGADCTFFILPTQDGYPLLPINANLAQILEIDPIFFQAEWMGLAELVYEYEMTASEFILRARFVLGEENYCINEASIALDQTSPGFREFDRANMGAYVELFVDSPGREKLKRALGWIGCRAMYAVSRELSTIHPNLEAYKALWRWCGNYALYPFHIMQRGADGVPDEDYSEGLRVKLESGTITLEHSVPQSLQAAQMAAEAVCETQILAYHHSLLEELRLNLMQGTSSLRRAADSLDEAYGRFKAYLMLAFHDAYPDSPAMALFRNPAEPVSLAGILYNIEQLAQKPDLPVLTILNKRLADHCDISIIGPRCMLFTLRRDYQGKTNYKLFDQVVTAITQAVRLYEPHCQEHSILVPVSLNEHLRDADPQYLRAYKKTSALVTGFQAAMRLVTDANLKRQMIAAFNTSLNQPFEVYLDPNEDIAVQPRASSGIHQHGVFAQHDRASNQEPLHDEEAQSFEVSFTMSE